MTKQITSINPATDTFQTWVDRTNELIDVVNTEVVTVNTTVGVSTGNGFVNGIFGANTLVTTTLRGGNVTTNAVLTITTNTNITESSISVGNSTVNTTIVGSNLTLANSTVSYTLILPTSAEQSNANFVLSANGGWVFLDINALLQSSNIEFTTNTTYATNSVIIANGSFGSNGSVLFSNGTDMYWNEIPAVTGNSGIIANADGIFVNANNGIIANADGVFVNTAFIATLEANSATGSLTNTFTVGTASYFVSNGNLGIGNTAPDYKLRVQGDISLSGGIHANGSLGTANQVLTSDGTVAFWANAGGAGATLTANNTDTQTFYLPMANATTGSWTNGVVSDTKLFFVPSTGTLNATIFNSLSDAAEKINVESVVDSLNKISSIRGVEFDWKDTGEKSSGVIAQEIEQVFPHLVISKNDSKSVNYNGIIAYLIGAIQELKERVRKLENG